LYSPPLLSAEKDQVKMLNVLASTFHEHHEGDGTMNLAACTLSTSCHHVVAEL
jgi:hypothetical protein